MPLALVAFGGNALLRPEDDGTGAEERQRAAEAAEPEWQRVRRAVRLQQQETQVL